MYEIREVLRLWLRGEGLRSIERLSSVDRKTARRYVAAAVDAGVDRSGGEGQLNDVLLAVLCETVRPHRPNGHGSAWSTLVANHDQLEIATCGWVAWFNERRLHGELQDRTPADVEQEWRLGQTASTAA